MPVAQAGLVRLTENLEKVAPFHAALTPDRLSVIANEIAIVISSFQDEMEARLHFAFHGPLLATFWTAHRSARRSRTSFPM